MDKPQVWRLMRLPNTPPANSDIKFVCTVVSVRGTISAVNGECQGGNLGRFGLGKGK
jgi:hypothetical protein